MALSRDGVGAYLAGVTAAGGLARNSARGRLRGRAGGLGTPLA